MAAGHQRRNFPGTASSLYPIQESRGAGGSPPELLSSKAHPPSWLGSRDLGVTTATTVVRSVIGKNGDRMWGWDLDFSLWRELEAGDCTLQWETVVFPSHSPVCWCLQSAAPGLLPPSTFQIPCECTKFHPELQLAGSLRGAAFSSPASLIQEGMLERGGDGMPSASRGIVKEKDLQICP